ncbi:MAG: hypothetical protein NXI31_04140 [bacterium]|nr:hypothetical protein [bacterium]
MVELRIRRLAVAIATTAVLLLGSCTTLPKMFEPAPSDPNDGYEGSLTQAGVSTEMDWGPKQSLLLSKFKALNEEHAKVLRDLESANAENQNLKAMLSGEQEALAKERADRAQVQAQFELTHQRLSEQEATILSLRIEKAKAEQAALLAKIDAMNQSMEQYSSSNVESAAMPPAGR